MGLTALCPGTFDPVTNGHLDIIERASETFETVVVAVLENPSKQPMFSVDERVAMLEKAAPTWRGSRSRHSKVCLSSSPATAGDAVIVKGLRAVSDYEFEIQMAQMNHRLGERGDAVHADEPVVVVPVVLAREGGRPLRRRRRGARSRRGTDAAARSGVGAGGGR